MIMSASATAPLAARFRALHGKDHLLVLPNAWDVASARLIEVSGAEAIATTSAALAWSSATWMVKSCRSTCSSPPSPRSPGASRSR